MPAIKTIHNLMLINSRVEKSLMDRWETKSIVHEVEFIIHPKDHDKFIKDYANELIKQTEIIEG